MSTPKKNLKSSCKERTAFTINSYTSKHWSFACLNILFSINKFALIHLNENLLIVMRIITPTGTTTEKKHIFIFTQQHKPHRMCFNKLLSVAHAHLKLKRHHPANNLRNQHQQL